ncbi:iron dicitrate transporter FecR [Parapedobacter pyrenivorans]|uniref:Iron dicitrate transporter FecR n=1 Tax=Parapedobacter pyrenivorans TaxID=1305674 RepID=A0A917HT20_9SPHI|nr:FecR family protein [Parapedobacter pyrenivorans]GGG89414.1 iron dicitrate transporter FecR [Parapedobacter pyrenivorans]
MRDNKRFIRILKQFLGDYRLDEEAFRHKHDAREDQHVLPFSDANKQQRKKRMKALIDRGIRPNPGRLYSLRSWHYVAASLALVCCLAGAWWWVDRAGPTMVTAPVMADLEPGSDRAQLILADGRAILLDEQQEGLLATQDGVTIRKEEDGSVVYSGQQPSAESPPNQLVVPRGGRYALTLPDGTRVWLNADSRLTYPVSFHGAQRRVELVGEAYFEVAHDANHPFVVHVRDAEVNVLGTRFNVRAYDNQPLETALLEGAVAFNHSASSRVLKPGEQAVVGTDGSFTVVQANIEKVMAWQNGYFYFEETPVRDIMDELARWYDADIDYVGDFSDLTFGGMVSKAERISTILNIMERTDQLTFRIEQSAEKGRRVTVMRK